ncbi:chemotaxis protein CheX [Sporosarcina sp. NPDC096371]|uniref:chemotaxis protein CheX n=1 Tax=Sporosarcina sp. NPDC096371 TaxID=3364530 RepID=UPI0038228BFD
MSTSTHARMILNATIVSLSTIIPIKLEFLAPTRIVQPYDQKELSVLIELVGSVKGQLILDSSTDIIAKIGQTMFGMTIESEMVESLTGEIGNMIAGNLCTLLEKDGLILDISPPTVMAGTKKFCDFKQAIKLPVRFDNGAILNVLLTIDEN